MFENNQQIVQAVKYTADAIAFGTVLGTLAGALPTFAAILSIVWISIQIWESKTFGKLKAKFRKTK